jgi:two-component system phosphate regulon sensor histidine kinase PhoR
MKKRKKFIWRLFFSYIFIAIGALLVAGWYFVHSLDAFLHNLVVVELSERARLLQNQVLPHLEPLDPGTVDAICKQSGKASETRFTVILTSGVVIGDTWETPQNMDNHAGRPEISGALANGQATSKRFSTTLQQNIIYVAIAVRKESQPIGVVRAAIPLARMEAQLARIRAEFWGIGGIVALLSLGVTFAISRQYGLKMQELKQSAARLAEGELAHRLAIPDSDELAGLAESLNRMAAQLESRMQTVVSQRNQMEAVLSSMLEGVIAVSRNERILSINPAAARWFDLDPEKVRDRSIPEAIRNLAIQKFVTRSLKSRVPVEDDVTVYRNGERILNIKSAPLLDVGPEPIGILIVFNDVTQLRRLEDMRREFVANVSHEIKTPLTAIKGFVETLHHNIVETPEEARRFLAIIARHVDRLNTIIEDLLMLSRIENEGERGAIQRETTRLRDIFQNAVQICRPQADEKRTRIELAGDEELEAMVDPVLIEQAVVNLLDNAVKYTDSKKTVRVLAQAVDNEIQIQVQDQGIGIEEKHLPRLFERFYRVDKARSRAQGGTGLGLAIVKHIAQAHGGHVTVESRLGEGSRFTLHLPRSPEQVSS